MAQANTNVLAGVQGNLRYWTCDFTTDSGDNSLSFNHGITHIVDSRVSFEKAALNTGNPKVTHSSGTATASVDDAFGYSGHAYFSGK